MIYSKLGRTPYTVSKICFGALTIGPLQANLSIAEGAEVLKEAFRRGINFVDTAELYETYPYIRAALKGYNQEVVIATKSYAYEARTMAKSLEKARRELDRDRIDIFMLHETESELTIKGHWQAVEYLLKAKAQGKVGAVGISTHAVAGVRAAAVIPEIEVIQPMLNMKGLGIIDGSLEEMLEAVKNCARQGKGIYGMKAIGGGNLMGQVKTALEWAFNLKGVQSVAVGMKSLEEVNVNVDWLLGKCPRQSDLDRLSRLPRKLHIEDWCIGCGKCVERCGQEALQIVDNKAQVDRKKCVLCGYCSSVCRDFCIKII